MITIHSNGSKWAGEEPDPIEALLGRLAAYPLDKRIRYRRSYWSDEGNGVVNFFGNFFNLSAVFNIDTDEPELIERLKAAIRANTRRHDYRDQACSNLTKGNDDDQAHTDAVADHRRWQ